MHHEELLMEVWQAGNWKLHPNFKDNVKKLCAAKS